MNEKYITKKELQTFRYRPSNAGNDGGAKKPVQKKCAQIIAKSQRNAGPHRIDGLRCAKSGAQANEGTEEMKPANQNPKRNRTGGIVISG